MFFVSLFGQPRTFREHSLETCYFPISLLPSPIFLFLSENRFGITTYRTIDKVVLESLAH